MQLIKRITTRYSELLRGTGCLGKGILIVFPFLFLCCSISFSAAIVDSGLRTAGLLPTRTPTHTRTPTAPATHTPTPPSAVEATNTAEPTATPQPTRPSETAPLSNDVRVGQLEVHFVDVGQGDSILVRTADAAVLIDGGDRSSGATAYLQRLGVRRLDIAIATHPHADHIGGLTEVLRSIPVDRVVTNGQEHTTPIYESFLDAIIDAQAEYLEVGRGDRLEIGSIVFEVLHPTSLADSLNNNSLVLRLSYGEVSFLFTGDSEREAEASMIASGQDLSAQVLKVAHHGSNSSSTPSFLQRVQPEVAIYSAGAGNPFGHPHTETLAALAAVGAEVYGIDVHGTVIVVTDGDSCEVTPSRPGEPRAPPTAEPLPTPTATPMHTPNACAPGQVDINSAPREELARIIHIDDERADELIRLRPFRSVDSLTRITGISAIRLRDIKEQGIACVP